VSYHIRRGHFPKPEGKGHGQYLFAPEQVEEIVRLAKEMRSDGRILNP